MTIRHKIRNTFIKEIFDDCHNVKPETFLAGCLLFGIMITGILIHSLLAHTFVKE